MTRILGITAAAFAVLMLAASASATTHGASRYGGVLYVGFGSDPDTLDPTVSRSGSSLVVYAAMCQRLYQTVENHGELVPFPVLAAALPTYSKDKMTVTVPLRRGIEFNDGTPFNAQAVVTTAQRFMTYPGSSRSSSFTDVGSVTAAGPNTVVYHLTSPDSTFDGGGKNSYVLSPTALATEGSNFGAGPVCVGPFMFDHRVVGDNVTLVKSPYYYKRSAIHLDKIVYKPETDAAAAVAALQAGDIQVLDSVAPAALPAVEQNRGLRVLEAPELGWAGIVINIGNKHGVGNLPYSNVGTPLASSATLRQAFEEAIDRNALNRVVNGGADQVSCTMIPPANTVWYRAITVPCTPHDPAGARKLVARSGSTNPTVHLLVTNGTGNLLAAQFIQAEEAAVGINLVIDPSDNATVITQETNGSFDTILGSLEPADVDPNYVMYQFIATSGARNYSGYSNPRLDLILANALKATSMKARETLYHAALQIVAADRPLIVYKNSVTIAAFSASVAGVQLLADGTVSVVNAQFT